MKRCNKKYKKYLSSCLIILSFGLLPYLSIAQELSKKMVTKNDYDLWGTIVPEKISMNGQWVSFSKTYDMNRDTLFVQHTSKNILYVCPRAKAGIFGNERSFAYQQGDSLVLINLTNGDKKFISHVNQFAFSSNGENLIVSELADKNLLKISIYNNEGKILRIINDVLKYQFNTDKNNIVYVRKQDDLDIVEILQIKDKFLQNVIVTKLTVPVKTLSWNSNGTALAFYAIPADSKEKGDLLYYYNLKSQQLSCIGDGNSVPLSSVKIDANNSIKLTVSEDGKKVFFGMWAAQIVKREINGQVEIWHADDKSLYTSLPLNQQDHYQALAVWWPDSNSTFQITSQNYSWITLTGNQQYALIADRFQYEPQYKWIADMDYHIVNLESGDKELFLPKQSGYSNSLNYSPDGASIVYYRDNNWWFYKISTDQHYDLTSHIKTKWDSQISDPGNEMQIWGVAGWSIDGHKLLLYDQYDVWMVSLNDNDLKFDRLTSGKEAGIKFRIDNVSAVNRVRANYSGVTAATFNLNKPLIMKGIETGSADSAYYILDLKKGSKRLTSLGCGVKNLLQSESNNAFVYLEETYSDSPKLIFKKNYNSKTTILAYSNTHQRYFEWGQSKMIHYNKNAQSLNAALFYPAGYVSGKSYPMIVYIYSIVSDAKNVYINPSMQSPIGFNISNFTSKGYFVLLPDISYEIGNTGISAADCVTAAVDKVMTMGLVDSKKIGLIGHSFGGYEVNFTITQTNMFAAAVSGSAVSDNISHYFTINTNSNVGESWRYENQQYRMGKSFYEDKESYYRNSPILHADNIKTPILTWVGGLDENVQPTQGKEFFLALRRLGKKNVMIVYPDDGHILSKRENQEDLTRKIEDWFGYYLKNESHKPWMQIKQ